MKNEQFHLEQYFQSNWWHSGQQYQYLFSFSLTKQLKGLAFVIIFTSIWLKHSIKLNLTESKFLNYFENTLKKKIKFQCFDKKQKGDGDCW